MICPGGRLGRTRILSLYQNMEGIDPYKSTWLCCLLLHYHALFLHDALEVSEPKWQDRVIGLNSYRVILVPIPPPSILDCGP
jgi:hypothetical protein